MIYRFLREVFSKSLCRSNFSETICWQPEYLFPLKWNRADILIFRYPPISGS